MPGAAGVRRVWHGLGMGLALPQGTEEERPMPLPAPDVTYIRWFADLGLDDIPLVGGKNASRGKLYRALARMGVRVPLALPLRLAPTGTFCARHTWTSRSSCCGSEYARPRQSAPAGPAGAPRHAGRSWPAALADAIVEAHECLSATAVRRPWMSRCAAVPPLRSARRQLAAGQQETYLNVQGHAALLDTCKRCLPRCSPTAPSRTRADKGFDQVSIALSVGVQRMVRADLAASGVMFSSIPRGPSATSC